MRKALSFLAAGALVCALAGMSGCSPVIGNSMQSSEAESVGAATGKPSLAPITLVHTENAFETFTANSAAAVLNGPDADGTSADPDSIREKNVCYSPLSLYLACSLVGMGTQGTTQTQLLDALGVRDEQELKTVVDQLRTSVEGLPEPAQLKLADSVWAGEGYRFTDSYLQQVRGLGAEAFNVTFGTEETDQLIAGWVSENTNGLIKPQYSTEEGQAAMLLNAVYFKDGWAQPFDVALNEVAAFHAPGTDIQTPFMRQIVEDSSFYQGDGYSAASLPFADGSVMTFIRPNDDVLLSDLLQGSESILRLLQTQLEPTQVDWWMPSFSTDSTLDQLDSSLKAIGIMNMFSPEERDAFAPMIDSRDDSGFHVSNVQQDVHFALDANGVEAAASTAIGVEKMSLGPMGDPVTFKLDRPFLYFVTSPDGDALFIGVIYNPGL